MSTANLEEVIQEATEDAFLPAEPLETSDADLDSPTEVIEPTTTDSITEPVPETPSPEVASPGAPKPAQDDFEKKFGIPALSSSGRENRIPHSRVVKITEKAVRDAKVGWAKELEASHIPIVKYQELETQNKDYTERLTKVAEFENIMLNDAPKFLDMLSGIPAYAQIFKQLIDAAKPGQTQPQVPAKPEPADEMPPPDQQLSDGSSVYSLEGLKARDDWNRAQVRKEILGEIEKTYGPLKTDYQQYQATQAVLPQVNAQIEDARTWPLFNDNEEAIVKILQQYPQASLERAYQHVVWPKLQAEQDKLKKEVETKSGEVKVNRDSIRAEILAELKKAPKSTSVGLGGGSKPTQSTSTTPRSLEDIISESVKAFKG